MPETNEPVKARVSIPFRTIAHFYDADDPSPEDHRELTERAENRIFRGVLDAPKGTGKALCDELEIALPSTDLPPGRDKTIIAAVRTHFRNRADDFRRDGILTQRVGLREVRLTLAVCIPSFLGIAVCSQFKGNPLVEVIENVLIIFCWVTIWQPFQSLVFDRWTQNETAKVYGIIAGLDIRVRAV
jgi:hypothetical protein